jgi:(1->4)-alpha-D-glucan 1-alpha-D-glucosylmutase
VNRSAIPSATYRLQLNHRFTLDDAAVRAGYFRRLGTSHLYLSPILAARAGSLHGYDVVDHGKINPELGGEPALRRLATVCHAEELGLILDIVPNHMAVGHADNWMWLDVLENGRSSAYAPMFDIDFDADCVGSTGKIVLPTLGEPYGEALMSGKLGLAWDASLHKLAFAYGPHRFPLRHEDYASVVGELDPAQANLSNWRDPARLHALLERQNFRLCWWRTAGDVINWRRFFDINELIGLRVEDPAVFATVHAMPLRLYEEGVIDGVRVDHIDGLADPTAYAQQLRHSFATLNDHRPAGTPRDGPYIIVEKILGRGEALPTKWPVDGTTGYDFMDQVNALQHDGAGETALNALWHDFSARPVFFDVEETEARTEVLESAFSAQLAACARLLARLARTDILTRDLNDEGFRRVLVALIARLRCYRGYATGVTPEGNSNSDWASSLLATLDSLHIEQKSVAFIADIMTGRIAGVGADGPAVVRRLHQLTSAVAAKAVEDTAFYRFGRLLSRNDVGFDAGRLALQPDDFVETGRLRAEDWPRAMLTTATHDHKRGEDVRARLAVLSELPVVWEEAARAWMDMTSAHRPADLAVADAYMLFQTLVGAWPLGLSATDTAGLSAFGARIARWLEKSLREAKLRSSWARPNLSYEAASLAWLGALLDPERSAKFLHSIVGFVARIAPAGAINGVVQAALRCTWPGVPDLYQGAELWDFSLVDPDNRRKVDFDIREQLLLYRTGDWASGAIKQAVIARLLAARRADAALFREGTVEPLMVVGTRSSHVLAFRRRHEDRSATVAVMLKVAEPVLALGEIPDQSWWADTRIAFDTGSCPAAKMFAGKPIYFSMQDYGDGGTHSTRSRGTVNGAL